MTAPGCWQTVCAFVDDGGLDPEAGMSPPPEDELPEALDPALDRLAELALLSG